MNGLEDLATKVYFGNELRAWAIASALFVVWFTVLPLARAFIGRRLRALTPGSSATALLLARELFDRTTRLFMVAVAAYLALRWLEVPAALERGIKIAFLIIVWLQIALWGTTAVRHPIDSGRIGHAAGPVGAAGLNILRVVAVATVWVVAFLMLLANLDVKIMPLVAGLGIGGLAIALAVQNVLGDLLASLSIALDKPFKVGDFLGIGEEKGTVEYIGIKSTRLRSISGEQIVMSNSDLLKSRVRNYGLLYERRISFTIGIVYETPRALIEAVPDILEEAICAQPKTRFDRAHFASYGDFALIYEAVYFVLDPQYRTYMDIQQAINLRLHEEFGRRGIEFAYPTAKHINVTLLPQPSEAGPG